MKKSNITVLIALGLILVFFFAFQMSMRSHLYALDTPLTQNEMRMETRTSRSFVGLEVHHGIQVEFLKDSLKEIRVTASKERLASIRTQVVNQVLVVERTNSKEVRDSVRVYISNDILRSLKLRSGAVFHTLKEVSGDQLDLDFSSDSKANIEITYSQVHCKAASGSIVNITGNSNQIDFSN